MSAINQATIIKRQEKLTAILQKRGLRALVLNPGPSLTYLTGLHFHLSERPVVGLFTTDGPPTIVLPELEAAKVRNLPYEARYFTYSEDLSKWAAAFQQGADAAGLSAEPIGVEDRQLRLLELRLLQQAVPGAEFVDAINSVAQLRMYKDADEIAAMQQAAKIAQQALEATLPQVKLGMTERELATELTLQLYRQGSDPQLPFSPIVSSGPNGANPHAFPSDRQLVAGELLVIDWGASKHGYLSDMTRTFGVGELNAEQIKIHETVQQANAAAHAIAKPGVTCGAVDKAARDVIEQAGYGQYFTHRTGHGLGMEGHEDPYMRADNSMLLETGMTFTIEPGIYIPDQDGVRIEDDVLVTTDGLHSFTDMERGIRIIG